MRLHCELLAGRGLLLRRLPLVGAFVFRPVPALTPRGAARRAARDRAGTDVKVARGKSLGYGLQWPRARHRQMHPSIETGEEPLREEVVMREHREESRAHHALPGLAEACQGGVEQSPAK